MVLCLPENQSIFNYCLAVILVIMFINHSLYRPEVFLRCFSLSDWQINDYPVVMILWNILLGVAAVLLTYTLVKRLERTSGSLIILGAITLAWLVVMPNAAYLMTDIRHIIGYCPPNSYGNVCLSNAWMSMFFFLFGATGWLSFIWSVRPIHTVITRFSKSLGWWFIIIIIPLCALGVLLGLIHRWNSWEIITDPVGIIATISYYLVDLTYLKNWFMMSALLYLLYITGRKFFIRLPWEK